MSSYMLHDLPEVTADEAPPLVPTQLFINLIFIAEDDHFSMTPSLS